MNKDNNKISFLIVDDDERFRFLLSESFEEEGFNIFEAENGLQALEIVDKYQPDLILLDITMPEMDGFEVCTRIRQNPKAEKTPIIMLTGMEGLSSIRKAYNVGVTDYISKPNTWPWPILVHRVKSILKENKTLNASRLYRDRLDQIKKTAAIGYWQWNYQDDIFEFNDKWAEIFQIKTKDKVNYESGFLKQISLYDIFTFKERISKVINDGQPFFIQIRIKKGESQSPGSFIWVEATCAILQWDDHRQQAKQICGTIREIIRPEQSESPLDLERKFTLEVKRQRDLYQTVISTMDETIIVLDQQKKISLMNKAAEQLFAVKPNEQINSNINYYIPGFETNLSSSISSKGKRTENSDEIKTQFHCLGKTEYGTSFSINCHIKKIHVDKLEYFAIKIRSI